MAEAPAANAGVPAPGTRHRRRLKAVLLVVVLFVALIRWISPDLTLGRRVEQRSCHGSYCLEHVRRPDWLLLAPADEIQIHRSSEPRYLSVDNPYPGSGSLRIRWAAGGVAVSDGSSVLTWDAKALAGIDD